MHKKNYFFYGIFISLLFFITNINAQQTAKCFAGCNLQASSESHVHYLPPPASINSEKTSEFQVTFVNATEEQQACVNYAAEIWSSILVSDVPIKVLVTFYPMSSFLGQSVSNLVKNFDGAPMADTWYLSSLADAITGVDQQPDDYDMDIFLSTSYTWYYGTDGNCPSYKFDLVDVALHEMCHGLGYFSLGNIADGEGSYGYITDDVLTRPIVFDFPDLEGAPTCFDRAVTTSNYEYFTDTTLFSNPSEELKDLFVGDDLFFVGENSTIANDNEIVKLYAPSTFYFASSILHLDEDTYPVGNASTLMTPSVAYGEANHNPGPVTIGLLKDLGWAINDSTSTDVREDEEVPSSFSLSQNYPNPFNPTTSIEYKVASTENVELKVFDILGREIVTLVNKTQNPGVYEVDFDASDLVSGIYVYCLQAGNFVSVKKLMLLK